MVPIDKSTSQAFFLLVDTQSGSRSIIKNNFSNNISLFVYLFTLLFATVQIHILQGVTSAPSNFSTEVTLMPNRADKNWAHF